MFGSLQGFLSALDAEGELLHISEPTSPLLDVTARADREAKSPAARPSNFARNFDPDHYDLGGRALLFTNITGCDFPLVINAFGSYRRMELALGCDETGGFEAIANRLAELLKPQPPSSIRDMLRAAKQFLPLLRVPPKRVKRGKCQDVIKLAEAGEVDLMRLPIIKCWPLDGDPSKVGYDITPEQAGTAKGEGRYITFAGMHTIHADDEGVAKPASHNIGMYRAQLIDETHLAMHWHLHHDGANHWRSWKRKGKPMPIAICLGGEAVLPYAATAPLPPGITELLMAGFLHGKGIEMVRAKTVPLWVPANSEIVIEGWVSTDCGEVGFDPRQNTGNAMPGLGPGAVFEGPFGDHTGFYSLPDRYPIVTVSAITHRNNAVYPTTIVGLPPQEDYYLGKATERIFFPLLKTLIHDIADYHLPMFGCFHNCAFIKINKQYPLQARRVMHAVWGAGQMAWTKMIVVVDDDVNVHDERAVLAAMMQRCDFARDVELVNGPLDILDHAAPRLGAGHKIGFDATRTLKGEETTLCAIPEEDAAPKPTDADPWVQTHNPPFAPDTCLFIAINKTQPHQGTAAIHAAMDAHPQVRFIIAVEKDVDITDWQQVFFYMCANADPGRDSVRRGNRLGFDATAKMPGDERHGQPVRDYPPVLSL